MKYMGSKAALLVGQLGDLLLEHSEGFDRFVDLFAGSAAVSHFVGERIAIPVHSVDLQALSRPLALAINGRTQPLQDMSMFAHWIKLAREHLESLPEYEAIIRASKASSRTSVLEARKLAHRLGSRRSFIMADYGGHYFSPTQAAALDTLWSTRPTEIEARLFVDACLIRTSSRCAASPGHTAQPFQPTPKLLPFIRAAWNISIFDECERQIRVLGARCALRAGDATVGSAEEFIERQVCEGDLVFCDPPYSAAQYSRFYHVLEGIARGGYEIVSGAGRSPAQEMRSRSRFSAVSSVPTAFRDLFSSLATKRASVLLTFPAGKTSLNFSGNDVMTLASEYFKVDQYVIAHVHSTLGGAVGSGGRLPRRSLDEMVLLLRPK